MAYEELERRKRFLEKLSDMVNKALDEGKHPPLNLNAKDIGEIGTAIGLNQSQAEYQFATLIREGFIDAETIKTKDRPFLGAFLQGLTDKGRRLIALLPPDESIEAVAHALNNLIWQIENSEESPQDKDRKSRAVRGLVDNLMRTASEVGSTGLGKALAEGMFG